MRSLPKLSMVAILAFSVFSFLFSPLLVTPATATGYAQMFEGMIENESDYFFTKGEVVVNDMSVHDLFDFTSDATNDVYWYPGVVGSVITSGSGGAGTTYEQTIDFGGVTVISNLEILYEIPNKLVVQQATGAFENYAMYVYKKQGNNAKLTIYSAVKKNPGITAEGLEFILNNTFPTLLNYLDKTGTFSVLVI